VLYVGLLNGLFLLRYALAGAAGLRVQVYWLVMLFLFAFSAFRWEVGCDWSGYLNQFQLAPFISAQTPVLSGTEGLWWWILAQLSAAGFAYPSVNVVSSAIFFAGVHVLARRQPDPLAFLILLFPVLIINMPMSGIRQGAAIGVMCVAFAAFIDRRPVRFGALTILASLMHSSALVFLLLAPLAQGRYSRQRLALAAILALPGLAVLVGGTGGQIAVSRYIGTGIDAAGGMFRAALLGLTGVYFLLVLRRGWLRTFPQDYSLAHLGALMMLAMPAMALESSVIGDRLGYYLVPIQALIFARIPVLPLASARQLHVVAPYLTLVLFFVTWISLSWIFTLCYLPYDTWITGLPEDAFRAAPSGF